MKDVEFGWIYDGREVMARCAIEPADTSVGIMGPYPIGIRLFEMNGSEIMLTEKMQDELLEEPGICAIIEEKYYDDGNGPDGS